jgi:signal transduction histidine kinase
MTWAAASRNKSGSSNGRTPAPTARLGESTRELARKTKEIIWVTSPACDTLEHLASYLSQYAGAFLASAGVAARFDVPVESPPLLVPGRLRHQVFLIAKEALSNAVKHARAREVWLRLRVESGAIRLVIEDSGCGFDITAAHAGHGLVNMRRRAAEFGGSIEWQPTPGGGTTVRLTLPLQIENRKSCKS